MNFKTHYTEKPLFLIQNRQKAVEIKLLSEPIDLYNLGVRSQIRYVYEFTGLF